MKLKEIKLDATKPRGKKVNDVLRSKRGSRHYNAKTDYVRAKEKQKAVNEDSQLFPFGYRVEYEVKNRSGDGGPDITRYADGVTKAASAGEAKAHVRGMYMRHLVVDIEVFPISDQEYRNYWDDA